ncbi:hypothetical protein niasHT_013693 [Heterodera trifolii]|uniref:Uncharacterized protein n=1 Tax=Heterodera trifolii TaxID=157864 RepID=A0ABD2LBP8_9BILA
MFEVKVNYFLMLALQRSCLCGRCCSLCADTLHSSGRNNGQRVCPDIRWRFHRFSGTSLMPDNEVIERCVKAPSAFEFAVLMFTAPKFYVTIGIQQMEDIQAAFIVPTFYHLSTNHLHLNSKCHHQSVVLSLLHTVQTRRYQRQLGFVISAFFYPIKIDKSGQVCCINILHPPGHEQRRPSLGIPALLLKPNFDSPANVDATTLFRNDPAQYRAEVRRRVERLQHRHRARGRHQHRRSRHRRENSSKLM